MNDTSTSFYRSEQRQGVAVPSLVWDIADVIFSRSGCELNVSKLAVVKIIHNTWKLADPTNAGLIQSKQFVEWFATNKNTFFKPY
jgi:hypothetical protein